MYVCKFHMKCIYTIFLIFIDTYVQHIISNYNDDFQTNDHLICTTGLTKIVICKSVCICI